MEPTHIQPFERADLFGGQGLVRIWNLMGRAAMPPFDAVLACELAPGGHVGNHRQQDASEVVIALAGRGVATVNGAEQPLQVGSLVYLPLGALLSLQNSSETEPLRYLIVKSRGPAAA